MFDLKKRNSLTLTGTREVEEFRRVAVRRKVKGAAVEHHVPHSAVSSGSYSCGISGSGQKEEVKRCLAKRSSVKPQVPPKPAHLQSPQRAGQRQALSPTQGKSIPQRVDGREEVQSPIRGSGVSVSCLSPDRSRLGLPSPVRGGVSNGVSVTHVSPTGPTQRSPHLTSSPVFRSPSPGKRVRGRLSCSPLKKGGGGGGGHSPVKLSPRNQSPLARKLHISSPKLGKMGSYSPAKTSRSWMGLHRIPSGKMEGKEKKATKSLSLPDLIVHLDENRIPSESDDCSPPRVLQSPSRYGPAITVKPPKHQHLRLNQSMSEAQLSRNGKERCPRQPQRKEHADTSERRTDAGAEAGKMPEPAEGVRRESEGDDKEGRRGGGKEEAKDEESTEQKLFNIASELLQTERAYVARLRLLDQVFCSRLAEEAGRGSFPPEVVKNIFSNISSIYSFHGEFLLPDLEKCISQWHESPRLGNVLLQHAPFLRMYADYVKNFDQAMELLRTWTERSSAFRNIIQDIQSQDECGSLTLQHHMLEPVQRLPRYEMLLRDYLKKLPKDSPDYELATKSLQTITMAASHSNSAIHKAECLKRLLEIYEMVGEEEVVNPANEFLREGRLLKLAARNASAMERHLFLFNNFLLCCTPKFSLVGQRYTVRCRIGVDGMQVQQTTNEDHPYSFQVSGKEKTLELQASSEQDRDDWIKVIREAADEFQKKNETFKLASKELNVEEPTEELGRRAPRWIRDNEVTTCMKCQEPFNALTRRRHHCRACGCVVCWKCSDNKVALEYDGNRPNKVCKDCYSILITQRGERVEGKKRRMVESEESVDTLMSGFLLHSDSPKSQQQVWCVIPRTEPLSLCLFACPQDVKPMSCISLPGCSVDDSLQLQQHLQGRPAFCLRRSSSTYTFVCDSPDLRQSWLAVLKDAATGGASRDTATRSTNGNVNDEGWEEFVIISGDEKKQS